MDVTSVRPAIFGLVADESEEGAVRRGRPSKATPAMIEEYLAGDSVRTVADRHRVSMSTVRAALDRAGIVRAAVELARQRELDLAIIRLRDEVGLSWGQISNGTCISESTLQARYARVTGPTGESEYRKQVAALPWKILVRRYQSGETTLAGMAAELHLNVQTVRHHLQRHGADLAGGQQALTLRLSDEELRSRHAAGETYQELAQFCGVSAAHVWRRVNFNANAGGTLRTGG